MLVRASVILMFLFLPSMIFSQEDASGPDDNAPAGTAFYPPVQVRRPGREESPRYPIDIVIGELGRGSAPVAALQYARDFLNALVRGNKEAAVLKDAGSVLLTRIYEKIDESSPTRYRIGGGRVEPDGAVSFMVRLIGREYSVTGEFYMIQLEEGTRPWRIDDLILEEALNIDEIREAARYDFSPYNRFY